MSRAFLALTLLAATCDAFIVSPPASVVLGQRAVSMQSPTMLFGIGKAPAKPAKKVAKKVVKKVVKKPLKKIVKAAPKVRGQTSRERRSAPKAAYEPGTAPTTLVTDFFSEKNWLYVAGSLLAGNSVGEKDAEFPVTPVLVVGAWILIVLRFTIFYSFFGTD